MKNIQIQYGFIKGRELDELQKVCLDRAGKSVNIRTLQQKLDNVSLSRAVEKWKNIPEIQRVLTRECISPTKGRELDVLQQELFESNEQRNKLQQKLFASKEQKNEMNMLQQKLLESNQQIGMLQQKLDQNVSQIELEQTMELEQIMLQQASLQMNTLQQAEDRENIRKLELENAKYKDKLENAKYNFRKRKNEMLNMLDSTNPSGLEKNGYNNIRRLLCNCEQAKLPQVNGSDAEIVLQEYYDNFTVKNTRNPFALIGSLVTNAVAGSNRDKYLYAVNFLRGERIDHINNIQRLEESIINLS